jgi:hypothetical protein
MRHKRIDKLISGDLVTEKSKTICLYADREGNEFVAWAALPILVITSVKEFSNQTWRVYCVMDRVGRVGYVYLCDLSNIDVI